MPLCGICTKNFFDVRANVKYCSRECSMKANNLKQRAYKAKWYLNSVGRTEKIERTSQERWKHSKNNYIMIKVNGELVYEHRVLAEKALGRPLPQGVIIHHTVAPDDNHGFCKLVICPDQDYHLLLHRRAKELGYEGI